LDAKNILSKFFCFECKNFLVNFFLFLEIFSSKFSFQIFSFPQFFLLKSFSEFSFSQNDKKVIKKTLRKIGRIDQKLRRSQTSESLHSAAPSSAVSPDARRPVEPWHCGDVSAGPVVRAARRNGLLAERARRMFHEEYRSGPYRLFVARIISRSSSTSCHVVKLCDDWRWQSWVA